MAVWASLALAGVIISLLPIEPGQGLVGNLLAFGAVLAACAYTVMTQRSMHRFSALTVLACQQAVALPMATLIWWLVPRSAQDSPASSIAMAGVAGLIMLAIPFLLFLDAMRQVGSARSVQYLALVPVFAMAIASLLLHERLAWYQYAGAITTVVAIAILTGRSQTEAPQSSIS